MWLAWLAEAAFAGLQVGAVAGAGAPLDAPTASTAPGLEGGLYLGWRASVGPLHLQPELVGRYNAGAPAGGAVVGGTATVGALVGFGAYAHGGLGIVGDPRLTLDAGLLAEVRPPLAPVAVGLRVGWEQLAPAQSGCASCAQSSDHWLMVAATAGLAF